MQNAIIERQNSIKISVIIPVYNEEKYLEECLNSVIKQTLKDIEIICVDDGSDDSSAQTVLHYAKNDNRIRYIHQEHSSTGCARNKGIAAAGGEYVAFLDADDCYPFNDVLEVMYKKAVANKVNICGGSLIQSDEKNKLINKFYGTQIGNTFSEEGMVKFCDYQYDYAFYRFIYNRQFLLDNGIEFPLYRRYQDPPFMLKAMIAAKEFYAIPLYTYLHHSGYKKIFWTAEKVADIVDGITLNLKISVEHGLRKTFMFNCNRLNNDFCELIVGTVLYNDFKNLIFPKLQALDKFIAAQNISDGELRMECVPYSKICNSLIEQNLNLRREGWFINKKLFRLYTFPVRLFGKLLRKIKHRRK